MAVATKRESDYYDSKYLADYYATLWTDHPALKDIDVYWRYFTEQTRSRNRSSPFVVLDCGTGTGRVLHSLIERAVAEPTMDISAVQFWGLDKSRFMLEQAKMVDWTPNNISVSWFLGDAASLDQLDTLSRPVDLFIFAFSAINHLHNPGEIDRFFSSLRALLKPDSLALISVCTPLLDCTEEHVPNPFGKVKEVRSKFLDHITYHEREVGQRVDGDLFINSLETEVWQTNEDGSKLVIESNSHNIPLRLLTRDGLRSCVSKAGLELMGEDLIGEEVIFRVKLSKKGSE